MYDPGKKNVAHILQEHWKVVAEKPINTFYAPKVRAEFNTEVLVGHHTHYASYMVNIFCPEDHGCSDSLACLSDCPHDLFCLVRTETWKNNLSRLLLFS